LTVTVTLYSSDIPSVGALCTKQVNSRYQSDDQSASLVPKRDPGITNFSIPGSGIENPIPGLQSLDAMVLINKVTLQAGSVNA